MKRCELIVARGEEGGRLGHEIEQAMLSFKRRRER